MLITPISLYAYPLVVHQYSHILYTHHKNIKTPHTLPSLSVGVHMYIYIYTHTHTPQEVSSNPLHYITNNNNCLHESNHVSLLNRLYIYIYIYIAYVIISLYLYKIKHTFFCETSGTSPSTHPPLSTHGETFLLFHFLFQHQLTLCHHTTG